MLSNVHFYTQVQSDVSQRLISLDRKAKCHLRATCSQLVCLVIFLASTIGMVNVQPLASMSYTTVSVQEVLAAPAEQFFVSLIVGSFCLAWFFWFWDLKYETLASEYHQIYQPHSDMIKASAPLTELNAHFHHLMTLAEHANITSNVIILAYAAAIIIYHLQP